MDQVLGGEHVRTGGMVKVLGLLGTALRVFWLIKSGISRTISKPLTFSAKCFF